MQVFLALVALCAVSVCARTTIPVGPKFTMQPKNTVHINGSSNPNVTLVCNATGYPKPTYTWYNITRNGTVKLVSSKSNGKFFIVKGKLTIDMTSANQTNATFQCAASNSVGTVLSNPVSVYLAYVEEMDKSPRPTLYANAFSGAVLKCNPPNYFNLNVNFTWFNGATNKQLVQSSNPSIFISSNSNLYFSMVNTTFNGSYYCQVAPIVPNPTSQKSPATPLEVIQNEYSVQEPVFPAEFPAVYPRSNFTAGVNATLECFAFGTSTLQAPLQYKWVRKDSNGKTVAIPKKAILSNWNRTMIIPNFQTADNGTYVCKVYRPAGKSISKSIVVSLQSAPNFTVPLKDKSPNAGSDVDMQCAATDDAKYSWYYNGEKLTTTNLPDSSRYKFGINGIDNPSSKFLRIEKVQSSDAGMYQCAATNSFGTVLSTGELTVFHFDF